MANMVRRSLWRERAEAVELDLVHVRGKTGVRSWSFLQFDLKAAEFRKVVHLFVRTKIPKCNLCCLLLWLSTLQAACSYSSCRFLLLFVGQGQLCVWELVHFISR